MSNLSLPLSALSFYLLFSSIRPCCLFLIRCLNDDPCNYGIVFLCVNKKKRGGNPSSYFLDETIFLWLPFEFIAISLEVRSKFFASFRLLSEYPLSIVNVKSTLETSLPVNSVLRTTVLLNFESDKSASTNVELIKVAFDKFADESFALSNEVPSMSALMSSAPTMLAFSKMQDSSLVFVKLTLSSFAFVKLHPTKLISRISIPVISELEKSQFMYFSV